METGESFWVSGVKKNGKDRYWTGSRKVFLIEAAALSDYLKAIGAKTLDGVAYRGAVVIASGYICFWSLPYSALACW